MSTSQFSLSLGIEPLTSGPKSGHGPDSSSPGDGNGDGGGNDLRLDRAFARVIGLFREVGDSLQQLEQATVNLETTTREQVLDLPGVQAMYPDAPDIAAAEINARLRVLGEASTSARRIVRRVVSHPVYGLGPGAGGVGLDERQALAAAGGIDRRHLRLL